MLPADEYCLWAGTSKNTAHSGERVVFSLFLCAVCRRKLATLHCRHAAGTTSVTSSSECTP